MTHCTLHIAQGYILSWYSAVPCLSAIWIYSETDDCHRKPNRDTEIILCGLLTKWMEPLSFFFLTRKSFGFGCVGKLLRVQFDLQLCWIQSVVFSLLGWDCGGFDIFGVVFFLPLFSPLEWGVVCF